MEFSLFIHSTVNSNSAEPIGFVILGTNFMFSYSNFKFRKIAMNEFEMKRNRRLLYLGIAITVPLTLDELAYVMVTLYQIPGDKWLDFIMWRFYFINIPLMCLLLNSQLRKDFLLMKIAHLWKSNSNTIHVLPLNEL